MLLNDALLNETNCSVCVCVMLYSVAVVSQRIVCIDKVTVM